MTPDRLQRLKRVLDLRQPDLTVVTDQVNKPHNLSAIVRTCDAVGIGKVHSVQPKEGYRIPPGTATGSLRWVDVEPHKTIDEALDRVRRDDMQLVAAHFSERAVNFTEVDYTRPTALILGAEKQGISDKAAAQADLHVTIPMVGMVQSFNVSVAAAIILTEAQRQRQLAGLYGKLRIDATDYQRLLFEWVQPEVAIYCQRNNLPYPPLTDDGQVVDGPEWYHANR